MTELTTQVNALLKEVAAKAILPRYRALHSDQIKEKVSGDYVTAADLASEAMLKKGLKELLPGSQVVGEEEFSANPRLLDDLDDESPIWVIDPLDGTINFVNGVRGFAIQLALIENNTTTMAWIHDPESGRTAWATKGNGAVLDGKPLVVHTPDQMKGVLYASKFAPPEIAEQVDKTRHMVDEEEPLYCSAWEYMRLCFNEMGFCLFTRLMPWDHAPGSLIYTEAGGISRCIDGEDYKPSDFEKKGLLLAPDEGSWKKLHHTLFGD
jgi:fructose-1,6-bisphosphatase/inositol monophosphatase family enzyme